MSPGLQQTNLGKAFALTGNTASIWLAAVTRGRSAIHVRSQLRNVYFRSHAKIREMTAADFCHSMRTASDPRPEALQVPVACLENTLGGPAYYMALAAVSMARQPRQIVEFGTFLGHGAMVLALNAPAARVLTIDLPDDASNLSYLNVTDQGHVRASRHRVGQCYRGTSCEPRISEMKCDSRQLRLRDTVESADLILVDGGHDTGCITADTENALSIARPGTVILWDDYFWLYPDVVAYLNRLADRLDLVRLAETNLVAYVR